VAGGSLQKQLKYGIILQWRLARGWRLGIKLSLMAAHGLAGLKHSVRLADTVTLFSGKYRLISNIGNLTGSTDMRA